MLDLSIQYLQKDNIKVCILNSYFALLYNISFAEDTASKKVDTLFAAAEAPRMIVITVGL